MMATKCHIYLEELLAYTELRDSENQRLCDVCKNKLGFHKRKTSFVVPQSISFPRIIHTPPNPNLVNNQVVVEAANITNYSNNGIVQPANIPPSYLQPITSIDNDVGQHQHQQLLQPSSPMSSLSNPSCADNGKRKAKATRNNFVPNLVNTLWPSVNLAHGIDGQNKPPVAGDINKEEKEKQNPGEAVLGEEVRVREVGLEEGVVVRDSTPAAFKRRRHCWKHGAKRQQLDEAVEVIRIDISDHKKKSWADYARQFDINKSVLMRALAKKSNQMSGP